MRQVIAIDDVSRQRIMGNGVRGERVQDGVLVGTPVRDSDNNIAVTVFFNQINVAFLYIRLFLMFLKH